MRSGYIGIDTAFAKGKPLPISICAWRSDRLVPERLRALSYGPPRGSGNALILDDALVWTFADATAEYLLRACRDLQIRPERIAIDSPSRPRRADLKRRTSEAELSRRGISCFATPSEAEFNEIRRKVALHLRTGPENRIPHGNQLWMLVGFALFERLSEIAECLEVYPQATARVIGSGQVHKSQAEGLKAQLEQVAARTGWPSGDGEDPSLREIAWGPDHDCLDAYLSAWVAALPRIERIALGEPPDDVIWVPRVSTDSAARGAIQPALLPLESPDQRTATEPRPERPSAGHREEFRCPACGDFTFARWPWGWDGHAGYRCEGISGSDVEERKREFKLRFGRLF